MSFLGRLFGTEKAIESVSNAIDKSILTDEERAELKVQLWKAAEPFKLAQRFFMLLVVIPYMLAWTIALTMHFFDVKVSIKVYELLSGRVGDVFLAMAIFYFGGGTINTLQSFKRKA